MDLTVVLVGPTGNGKSATGNTILRRNAFISRAQSSTGTETCELQTSLLEDDQTISVIDTPGFVDTEPELLGEEVKKCFTLARNRIHAILFVVSVEHKFSKEYQIDAVRNLQKIFGENIINYMIVVIAGVHLNKYDSLLLRFENRAMIRLCEDRYVCFNNRIEDEVERFNEVQNLLSQVTKVISLNGGKPFTSQVFELQFQVESTVRDATTRLERRLVEAHATTMNANKEQTAQRIDVVEARLRDTITRLEQQIEAATMKADERAKKYFEEATSMMIQQMQRLEARVEQRVLDTTTRLEQQHAEAYAAHMKVKEIAQQQMTQRINEEVESREKDVTTRLEQQLAEAEAARLKADERAQEAQKNSGEQIQKLKEVIERAQETQKNSDEQLHKLKEVIERAQEAQKNSDEHIQKLEEVFERAESRKSETMTEIGSSSFHVYDPSSYLLQSAIK